MDSSACNTWASDKLHLCLGTERMSCAEGKEKYLLIVDNLNLGGQGSETFARLARENARALVWLLPPNCTDLIQPVDSNVGKQLKDDLKKKFKAFIHAKHVPSDRFNLHVQCHKDSGLIGRAPEPPASSHRSGRDAYHGM